MPASPGARRRGRKLRGERRHGGALLDWFVAGISAQFTAAGYQARPPGPEVQVVPHRIDPDATKPYRRKNAPTFVVSMAEMPAPAPEVGAILHVHAWIEDTPATEMNYPCGTIELATSVAELVRNSPDPSRAVVGQKNHGLTITGHSLDEIFERVGDHLVHKVPMN